jgi:protein MpaA
MRRALVLVVAAALVGVAAGASATPRATIFGRSVQGRPLMVLSRGEASSRRTVLVVGCIHGNEAAGVAIVRALERARGIRFDLRLVPTLNPDGEAADTRGNAHGVDLNRNFPYRWRPLGGVYDSGPRPLSEPETRAAVRLISRLRPAITIWFHQHMRLVDESGGDVAVERRFAGLVRLPLRRLPRYPGSATQWQNASLRGSTAFVTELPAGSLTRRQVARYAAAVIALGNHP